MTREEVYRRAWRLMAEAVKAKTGWGKNELAALMADCLQRALDGEDVP